MLFRSVSFAQESSRVENTIVFRIRKKKFRGFIFNRVFGKEKDAGRAKLNKTPSDLFDRVQRYWLHFAFQQSLPYEFWPESITDLCFSYTLVNALVPDL